MRAVVLLALGSLLALAPAARAADGALTNPGFEDGSDGWTLHAYGARPVVEKDAAAAHGGKHSLRVSAAEPSDAALSQEVRLTPGHLYRLSGWVRTRGLDARGAPVYGTLQVQYPGGRGTIAGGANHGADGDWAE